MDVSSRFENALIDLIETYLREGLSSPQIRNILNARSGDAFDQFLIGPSPEEEKFLDELKRNSPEADRLDTLTQRLERSSRTLERSRGT